MRIERRVDGGVDIYARNTVAVAKSEGVLVALYPLAVWCIVERIPWTMAHPGQTRIVIASRLDFRTLYYLAHSAARRK